jgi:hypothetical protein
MVGVRFAIVLTQEELVAEMGASRNVSQDVGPPSILLWSALEMRHLRLAVN